MPSDNELLVRIDEKVDALHREVMGNGQPGLRQRVESLESSRSVLWGMGALMTFIGGIAEWLFHRK